MIQFHGSTHFGQHMDKFSSYKLIFFNWAVRQTNAKQKSVLRYNKGLRLDGCIAQCCKLI